MEKLGLICGSKESSDRDGGLSTSAGGREHS